MSKKSILFLFVFCNYYNPGSIYLTLFINILLILAISFDNGKKIIRFNSYIVVCTLLILIWAMFIMAVRSNINTYVLGKYLRVTASTLSIMIICSGLRISAKQLIDTLAMIFIIHILAIGMQSVFPQLDIPMANFFGFDRESTVISDFSIRNLGLSSSYDTAALICLSSMLFFFLQYLVKKRNIYILLSLVSLLSCIRTSRTGMILGILFFAVFCIVLFFSLKGVKRLVPILFLSSAIILAIYFVIPIIASSTELLSEAISSNSDFSLNYTTGSVEALTNAHLDPLKAPIFDLIFGFGIDPNKIIGKGTDIGYVKLIYHVGIIGLVLIVLLYLYIFRKTVIIKKRSDKQSNEFILSSFLVLFILLVTVMNYKSLEMYSRGSHDLILIIFCVLIKQYHSRRVTLSNGPTYLENDKLFLNPNLT